MTTSTSPKNWLAFCKQLVESSRGGSVLQSVNQWIADNARIALYKHGQRVGRHPWMYVLGPLLLTAVCSVGVLNFKADQEVRELFTPTDAESHREFAALQNYFGDPGGMHDLVVHVQARDGGSLMRPGYPHRVLKLLDYLTHNYSINNLTFSRDLQINHKDANEALRVVLSLMEALSTGHSRYPLKYPVTLLKNQDFFVGHLMSSIATNPVTHQVTEVKVLVAHFRSACGNRSHFDQLKKWSLNFLRPDSIYNDSLISFSPWSDYLLTQELLRVSTVLVPYVLLSFVVLIVFAMSSSLTDSLATSKPWEALAGVTSVALAVSSSFGVLFALGYSFVGTLAVMPVLVLAMGLDVTFIVLRNWHSTNPEFDVPSRLAETWAESGTSVIITSLTNVMSTAIGTVTNTPAIQTFCLSTTIAVVFLFVYQLTFFAAVIALGGRREERGANSLLCCLKTKQAVVEQTATPRPKRKLEAQASLENRNKSRFPHAAASVQVPARSSIGQPTSTASTCNKNIGIPVRILNDDWWHKISIKMAHVLCNTYCRVFVILGLIVYWILSIWGCLHLQLGLTPEKLFLKDSLVLRSVEADQTNIVLDVFVQSPPNFTSSDETQLFYAMVKELEDMPESLGHHSTNLWVRPYEEYLGFMQAERDVDFYPLLPSFLETSDYTRWRPFVTLATDADGQQVRLTKFFFTVAYKRHRSWTERVSYTTMFRQIVQKYAARFNVSLYCEDNNNFVVDQLQAIPGNTLQDVLITALCMAVICLLFIPNTFNTMCAMATIFSINVGVFGLLVHWDVALDPVSMTSLLMSIGYSVDFTSHISYHYYISAGADQRHKLIAAVSSIGLPMIETGFSTILSVGCLCLINSYLVWVYFKTTLLVVVLGLFHGLIVLPTFLAWLPMDVWDWIYKSSSSAEKPNGASSATDSKTGHHANNPDIVQIALGEVA